MYILRYISNLRPISTYDMLLYCRLRPLGMPPISKRGWQFWCVNATIAASQHSASGRAVVGWDLEARESIIHVGKCVVTRWIG